MIQTTRVGVERTFDAAHCLPNYDGACARLHGHTYRVRVEVAGVVDPATQMIIDMKVLGAIVDRVLEVYDHQLLNDVAANPTAECLAYSLFHSVTEELESHLASPDPALHPFVATPGPLDPRLYSVTLWETPTSYVVVQAVE